MIADLDLIVRLSTFSMRAVSAQYNRGWPICILASVVQDLHLQWRASEVWIVISSFDTADLGVLSVVSEVASNVYNFGICADSLSSLCQLRSGFRC